MRVDHLRIGVIEAPPCRRCEEHHMTAFLTHPVNEDFEVIDIVIPCPVARLMLLLVVMAELTHHVVARPHHGEDFLKTVAGEE